MDELVREESQTKVFVTPKEPLTGLPPEVAFINYAIDAANDKLVTKYRQQAKLMADAHLTTSAILAVTGDKTIDFNQLRTFLSDPRVIESRKKIIEKYRTPDPRFNDPFFMNASIAMNQLYPVKSAAQQPVK